MTLSEFFGCAFLAFGSPTAMLFFTIAHDPIRIIILIASAFFWLVSLLISSLLWFSVIPLRDHLAFGLVFSVLFQEAFRFLVYKILRRTEKGLVEISEFIDITENKHLLAYVCGLGFGIMSGVFALVNILADSVGPATMGLKTGTEIFFIISAAQTLSIILLHTFWSIIYFNALDTNKYTHIIYVIFSHLFVSCLTLLNRNEMYVATLLPNYIVTILTGILAFNVAGGTYKSFKQFVTCK